MSFPRRAAHRAAPALLLLTLLGSASAGLAQQSPAQSSPAQQVTPNRAGGGNYARLQLSPGQQQQLFVQQKAMQLRFQRDRLQLLKTHEGCISAATNREQLQACKRQERQANMDLRRRHRQDLQAMLQRYGITLPDRPNKGGRWGGGGGGGGGGGQQPGGPGGQGGGGGRGWGGGGGPQGELF